MKKLLLIIAISVAFAFASFAQDSRGFSFQGIARDASGNVYGGKQITLTIYLETGSTTSTSIYTETQNITTDAYGVFSTIIGLGTASKGTFSAVDFSQQYNVQVDITIGTNTNTLVNYALQSVPYAKYANNGCPAGTIMAWAGTSAKVPTGWIICDGSALNGTLAQYSDLYAAIGNSWGGNGTTFNLPDLRGMFLRGVDGGTGKDPDVAIRSAQGTNAKSDVGSIERDTVKAGSTNSAGDHTHDYGFTASQPSGSSNYSIATQINLNKYASLSTVYKFR